jgi:flavin prenyltransferase
MDKPRRSENMKRIIIGISGATGAIYGIRMLQVLHSAKEIESHLVLSTAARRTITLETDYSVDQVETMADFVHRSGDIAASISSGSFRAGGMVVAPCSMKTLSGITNCYSDNLLLRAADVILKERRPLVLLVRETPMHLGHLHLLVRAAEMGAIVMPPVPAFYHRPTTLNDVIDQTVNRSLDMLGVELEQDLFPRWEGVAPRRDRQRPAEEAACCVPSVVADQVSTLPRDRNGNATYEKD